jgi:LacI family transcriptional regulator
MDDQTTIKPTPKARRQKAQTRVTMTDVAKAAGCSQATVSFVLNRVEGVTISPAMRAKVFDAARALGYGSFAAGLRQGAPAVRLGAIGFIVDQLATSPESVNAIEGARQACWDDGGLVLVAQTQGNPDMEEQAVASMLRAGVSGLIYMTIFTRKIQLPDYMAKLPVPVVLSNCYTADHAFPSIVPNEVEGGRRGTEALIGKGHRRIAMITGEPWMEAARDRLKGYRKALSEAGLLFDPALVVEGNWTPSSGFDAAQRVLAVKDPPTAIFCQNDKMASGCYAALREAGLSVPEDMMVLGYDDDELCRHLRPQLSSLVLPHRAMGAWAVETLRTMPLQASRPYPITRMECDYIDRASTKPG